MTDDRDTDITAPETEPVDSEEAALGVKPRKRFGLGAMLGAMFLSSAFGAAIIGAISHFNPAKGPDLSPLTDRIETVNTQAQDLAAETKTLKAQLARLQRTVKASSAPVSVDLTPVENRLQALESAEPKEIDPELLARLEALQDEGSQALDLSDILSRLEDLENRPIAASVAVEPMANLDMSSAMAFPTDAVLAALNKPEGWLKKSLKKHISVQSDGNPRYLVELVNKNLEAGNIEAAIAAFEKMPPEAKAAGQMWRESLNR